MPATKRSHDNMEETSRKKSKVSGFKVAAATSTASTSGASPKPGNKAASETVVATLSHNDEHLKTLQLLQLDFDALRQLVTCKICERLLYEPYVLSCGHTYCYSCLTTWFIANKKKTCPNCRVSVTQTPAPSYVIKEMTLVFVQRPELLPEGETSEQHSEWQKEEAEIVLKDKANQDPRTGGLFRGCFTKRNRLEAVRDATDGVDRCPSCHWELEEGMCNRCGIHIDGSDFDSDGDSFDSDMDLTEDLDADLDAQDEEFLRHEYLLYGPNWRSYAGHEIDGQLDSEYDSDSSNGTAHDGEDLPHGRHGRPQQTRPFGVDTEDEEEEDDDDAIDSTMSGFIDDETHSGSSASGSDSDGGPEVVFNRRPNTIVRIRSSSEVESVARPEHDIHNVHEIHDSDSDSDSAPEILSSRPAQTNRSRRRARPIAISSSSDDEDVDAIPHVARSLQGGFSSLEGTDDDDDDDDEDDNDGDSDSGRDESQEIDYDHR